MVARNEHRSDQLGGEARQAMTGMVKYDAMIRAIDACYSLDEAKEIRSQAAALREYARQANNRDAERKAAEIRIRAERRVGSLTAAIEQAKRGPKPKSQSNQDGQLISAAEINSPSKAEVLREAGISSRQASEWERLADIPDTQFEAALAQSEIPTTGGVIAAAAAPAATRAISKPAMKLWSWVKALKNEGYLDRDPDQLMKTMSGEMLDDMHTMAPKIAMWFGRIGKLNAQ
jgi:hypothetical protein